MIPLYWLLIIIFIVLIIITIISILIIHLSQNQLKNKNRLEYAGMGEGYIKPIIMDNLLTREKCQEIMEYCEDKLFESEVVGGKHKDIRNSQQYWIPKTHPLIKPLFEQLSSTFNIPYDHAEDLQVVRYRPGQYYNEHHDSCCDNNDKCYEFVKRGGQRMLTVLIYLNNDFEEGATYFPNLQLQLKASPGSAIVFHPLAINSNKCHPLALHAGLPVKSGEKWVANIWFRQNVFL